MGRLAQTACYPHPIPSTPPRPTALRSLKHCPVAVVVTRWRQLLFRNGRLPPSAQPRSWRWGAFTFGPVPWRESERRDRDGVGATVCGRVPINVIERNRDRVETVPHRNWLPEDCQEEKSTRSLE